MGNATSSALRADDPVTPAPGAGDDSPAFGSLANLGGPRKFKKKPVLVLDPEELEQAHMMFQEASAELLGEEVERLDRPKPVLGLAPIDDEDAAPEDMGESDDSEAGDDNDAIPSTEDVLRVTASREPVESEPAPAVEASEDDFIAQQLESLDVDHRIFPSLPLKSEEELAAEEEVGRAAIDALAEDVSTQDIPTTELPGNSIEIAYATGPAHAAPRAQAYPVNPLPEPKAVIEPIEEVEPAPPPVAAEKGRKSAATFSDAPFMDFPHQPLRFEFPREASAEPAHDPEYQAPTETACEAEVESFPEPTFTQVPQQHHVPTSPDFEEDWEEEAPLGLEPEYEEPQACEAESEPELEAEPDGSYTEIEDEPVDGYAFMYARSPRGRTLNALADGESNSLRAKLLKEKADPVAEVEQAARRPSILSRIAAWLRGLFG